MREYRVEIKRTVLQIAIWSATVSTSAWISGKEAVIPGFLVGVLTSTVYFLLMCYRIRRSADMPIKQAISYMRTGWGIRFAFIVMMLYLSANVPWIDFWAAVLGLFSLYVVLIINVATDLVKNGKYSRKG
jgi:hypothetical protein